MDITSRYMGKAERHEMLIAGRTKSKPDVVLANGRVLEHYAHPTWTGATDLIATDGHYLSDDEWDEYCRLAK
jgi:hypothetical protein